MNSSRRGGLWFGLLFLLAALFAFLALVWMTLLPFAVAKWVRKQTGFPVELQTLYVNPFTGQVRLHGLVLTNPSDFPRQEFVDLPELRIDLRLSSLFGSNPIIDTAVLHVAEIAIVKNREGVINAQVFRERLIGTLPGQGPAGAKASERRFLIKRLQVRFDRLLLADYSKRRPRVRVFDLQLDHTYENVTSVNQLAAPLREALTPFAGLIGAIIPEAGTVLRSAGNTVKAGGRKTGQAVKGFFEALEKRLKP